MPRETKRTGSKVETPKKSLSKKSKKGDQGHHGNSERKVNKETRQSKDGR